MESVLRKLYNDVDIEVSSKTASHLLWTRSQARMISYDIEDEVRDKIEVQVWNSVWFMVRDELPKFKRSP